MADQRPNATSRRRHLAVAAALAIALCGVALTFMTTVAGGADAYGYVSQAELWRHGKLVINQPWAESAPWPERLWTFSPLGYRPDEAVWGIVPTYSPGLPMLMALAQLVAGRDAQFWVVPLTGIVLVLATFGLGRRLTTTRAALAATFLIATSPVVLFMIMAPMTDVPVAAFWTAAIFFLLAPRPSVATAAAAGCSASIAVLIRPNLASGSVILGLWYVKHVVEMRRDRAAVLRAIRVMATFAATAAIGLVAVAMINRALYGSPWRSGYGEIGYLFGWGNVLPNVRHYFGWLMEAQTPLAMVGFIALLLPVRTVWPASPDRFRIVLLALFTLVLWAQYCYYEVFDAWWYLRFLLPSLPLILIALSNLGERLWARGRLTAVMATSMVIGIGAYGVWIAYDRSAFEEWKGESRYVSVARMVRGATDRNGVILSMQHSGALRYYAGRVTLRFDWLSERWLDRTRTWLIDHGSHPYALLDEWETERFRTRFGDLSDVGRLHMKPLAIYKGASNVYLYDLADPPLMQAEPLVIDESWANVRFVPPAPAPRVVFAK